MEHTENNSTSTQEEGSVRTTLGDLIFAISETLKETELQANDISRLTQIIVTRMLTRQKTIVQFLD